MARSQDNLHDQTRIHLQINFLCAFGGIESPREQVVAISEREFPTFKSLDIVIRDLFPSQTIHRRRRDIQYWKALDSLETVRGCEKYLRNHTTKFSRNDPLKSYIDKSGFLSIIVTSFYQPLLDQGCMALKEKMLNKKITIPLKERKITSALNKLCLAKDTVETLDLEGVGYDFASLEFHKTFLAIFLCLKR
ncbi:hypothetical protein M422DRAFT_784143 [Sphaerobolus stellatus SS14]|uniref:Uncharacterized protein n=1 Tax=Sphaerobolus stellatus (strain SS14) TaxID=990650 RepID=A0A0C9TJV7_SPHS4|nr:hypothetical protein M422DRAFT_784143 [Sphaerobolus stellatus SS14]